MQDNYLIDGKYRILKILGKGGMSTVYLAENIKLGALWAIKEIKKTAGSQLDMLAEANILKRLSHPALPRVFDIIENEESIFIIVDYIEGESLDRQLEESAYFPEETALKWAKQLCEVLVYLHDFKPNPIIYRDMKPSNIILTADGGVKLIDFGIAREYKEDSENDTVYIGTKGYAAPEQYGFGQTDMTSDIYSLGITLFHMVTGRNPNRLSGEIKPVRHYNNRLSTDIEFIISKCIRNNAEERYQTSRELLRELESIINKRRSVWKPIHIKNTAIRVPEDYKKVAGFVGDRAAGTTILVMALSEYFSSKNKNVGIVDLSGNCKLCSMYGCHCDEEDNVEEENYRKGSISLPDGKLTLFKLDRHRALYFSKEYSPDERGSYINMIERLQEENDIVLIDMSFRSDRELVRYLDRLYIVKDMDMYGITGTSEYLRELKIRRINLLKSKFIINKYIKSSIKAKAVVDTITSRMGGEGGAGDQDFMGKRPEFFTVPFDMENYRLMVESVNQIQFSCSGFSTEFKRSIQDIAENIYPSGDRINMDRGFINIFSKLKESRKNAD